MSVERAKIIGRIADHLTSSPASRPQRVAIDGITAAGKTTLARELAAAVGPRAIHLSMDGYHHPRAHRHRQGRDSAAGYYQDAYDFEQFSRLVLEPLGPDGNRHYRKAILDLATDQAVDDGAIEAAPDAILIVDGSFLQRELSWDTVIFVDTPFEQARQRGTARDAHQLGGAEQAGVAFDNRYHAASRQYLADVHPADRADIVLDNGDLEQPRLRRIGGVSGAEVSLFSYGTLQQPEVQRHSFSRLLAGRSSTLPGYRAEWVTITDPVVIQASGSDRHPIVLPGEPDDHVAGTVFTVTTEELAAADHYEVADYRRRRVTLDDGSAAWVYLAS